MASYVLFALICLVFVFIGVPFQQSTSPGGAALVVNNKVISWSEYQNYLEILKNQESKSMQIDAKRQKQINRQAIDALLNIQLMVERANQLGFVAADAAVRDRISALSVFKADGRFSRERYYGFLSARRWSATYFEGRIKREMQVERLQQLFNRMVYMSRAGEAQNQELAAFRTRVQYVSFGSVSDKEETLLSGWLKSGDEDSINQMVEDKKWEWETTDEFDLSRRALPGLASYSRLFEEVVKIAPSGGLIKRVIKVKDKSFILKVAPYKQVEDAAPKKSLLFFTNRIMGRMFFLSWTQAMRAQAKLKWHPRLQQML